MSDQASVNDRPRVSMRLLELDDLGQVRRMIATAFAGEPFAVGMFGSSPIDRLVGMIEHYENWPEPPNPVVLVASAAHSIVGVSLATLPGQCQLCDQFETKPEAEAGGVGTRNVADAIEHEFKSRCRSAHLSSSLPAHAHIQTVATEPFLAGAGVGRQLMSELLDRLYLQGVRCAVLECLTTRRAFYERCGFRAVADFSDPGGDDLRAVLMQIDSCATGFGAVIRSQLSCWKRPPSILKHRAR